MELRNQLCAFSQLLMAVAMSMTSLEAAQIPGEHERRGSAARPDIPDGYMIIEGDIIVPDDFFGAGAATYATNLWPDGVVRYAFDSSVEPINQQRMLAAMAEWEAVATVDFVPWSGQGNYLYIRASTMNSSSVGMQGGSQEINIVSWESRFIIAHEIGHALGYWHEQSRADRDSFVRIEWGNISQTECEGPCDHNFEIRPNQGPLGSGEYGPYDFDSVMHYDACAFSVCGFCSCTNGNCRTITVLPPNEEQWQCEIGQLNHLSAMDKLTMSFLYAQANWRFVDDSSINAENGTFLEPWRGAVIGLNNTPEGGTLFIQPGKYPAVGRWTRPMRMKAPLGFLGGTVTLGN